MVSFQLSSRLNRIFRLISSPITRPLPEDRLLHCAFVVLVVGACPSVRGRTPETFSGSAIPERELDVGELLLVTFRVDLEVQLPWLSATSSSESIRLRSRSGIYSSLTSTTEARAGQAAAVAAYVFFDLFLSLLQIVMRVMISPFALQTRICVHDFDRYARKRELQPAEERPYAQITRI